MICLQMLGGVELEDPARPELRQLISQPKPLALLCVLALAGPNRFSRRDTLVNLFWPDLDHDHARAALRQTLLVLRRFLGSDTITNRGDDEIGINPARLWCDATVFQQLSATGDAAGALQLYRGNLLEGIHIAGAAPELAQWLDAERFRLRRLAQRMAWQCADQAHEDGNSPVACQSARRAVELEPFDEQGVRRLLQLLDQLGDQSGAVREYCLFAQRLAQELEITPSAETQALIAAIRARAPAPGTDPIAGLEQSISAPAIQTHVEAVRSSHLARRAPWLLVPAAVAAILLGFRLSGALGRDDPVTLDSSVIALMPWRVGGADPGLAYLREGMLDLLHATLTGERGLRAGDPRTVMRALHLPVSDSATDVSIQTAVEVAGRIGAGRLIQGAVVGSPAHLTLTATEFTTINPRAPLAFSVSGTIDSLAWMVERLTAQILARESRDPEHVQSLSTTSLPALRTYLEGRAAYRRGLYTEAARDFDQALMIDSNFALAAVGLATGALTFANSDWTAKGQRIAHRESSRLSARDLALVNDLTGPRYPLPPDESEYLTARSRTVRLAPESPEAWYWLGDSFYHDGRLLAIPEWRSRAIAAFERAILLDSAYAAPYEHLIEARLQADDTLGIRRLASIYAGLDSTGEYGDYLRWRVAVGLGDSSGLAALRARFNRMSIESLYRIAAQIQLEGIDVEDADHAVEELTAQSSDDRSRMFAGHSSETLWSNEGRPLASLAATEVLPDDRRRRWRLGTFRFRTPSSAMATPRPRFDRCAPWRPSPMLLAARVARPPTLSAWPPVLWHSGVCMSATPGMWPGR